MRAIFIAAIVLAFIAVVYGQTCDANAASTCATDYSTCASGKTDIDAICTCYGSYGACLTSAGCLTGQQQTTFDTACQAAGCTAAQCAPASTLAASVAVILAALAAF